jgi:hypothetical protein
MDPEELMAYADGETSAATEGRPESQELLSDFRRISLRMRAWSVEEPERLAGRMPARIEARLKRQRRGVWAFAYPYRWLVAGGAAVVTVVLLSLSLNSTGRYAQTDAELRIKPKLESYMAAPPPPGAQPQAMALFKPRLVAEPQITPPMIVRTAELSLSTRDFGNSRNALESAVQRHGGYVASIEVSAPENAGRSLDARARVPSKNLDNLLADLRKLGRVLQESQGGNDVTKQYVDLDARLRNAQNTEERLSALLRERTGKLSDVLEVETEISRVRGEIEQMSAAQRNLANQVELSTVHITVAEDFKAQVNVLPRSGGDRLRNAAVEGYTALTDSLMSAVELLLAWGPRLVLWSLILFWPVRKLWRRARRTQD